MRFIRAASLQNNPIILDVRSPEEYARESLKMPHIYKELSKLDPLQFIAENHIERNVTINILCASGARASQAAEMFERAGFDNVAVVIGGIIEAEYEGIEIVRH